jgi:hypothetical protein
MLTRQTNEVSEVLPGGVCTFCGPGGSRIRSVTGEIRSGTHTRQIDAAVHTYEPHEPDRLRLTETVTRRWRPCKPREHPGAHTAASEGGVYDCAFPRSRSFPQLRGSAHFRRSFPHQSVALSAQAVNHAQLGYICASRWRLNTHSGVAQRGADYIVWMCACTHDRA